MDTVLGWAIPALVVFGGTAVLAFAIGWAVRAARRSPRARASAEQARTDAGAALVRLDDEIGELDIDVSLAGAMYGGDAPPTLRRAKMGAQHVRDQAFADYSALDDPALAPADRRRRARDILTRLQRALADLDRARTEHGAWVERHRAAGDQIAAARSRLDDARREIGDPDALVASLQQRFDPAEWNDAAVAAASARAALADADAHLTEAGAAAADPTRNALPDLAAAERSLRDAQSAASRLDQSHRQLTEASEAVTAEFAAARTAVRQASDLRAQVDPDVAMRLGVAVAEASAALDALEPSAARLPLHTVDRIAKVRDRLDLAIGDARTAQQRLRGARTALPGTLATAIAAVTRAEASASGAGADARARLAAAQRELADARRATDPVEALDAARRAMRHAEDSQALAAYDRMGRR